MRSFVRNYDVNQFGQPVSTVPAGGWTRGRIIRGSSIEFRSTVWDLRMLDPTNPLTWTGPGVQ